MSMSQLPRRTVLAGGLATAAVAAVSARADEPRHAPAGENGMGHLDPRPDDAGGEGRPALHQERVRQSTPPRPTADNVAALRGRPDGGRGRRRSTTSAASSTSPGRTTSRTPHQIAGLSNGMQRAALTQPQGRLPLLIATDQEHGSRHPRRPARHAVPRRRWRSAPAAARRRPRRRPRSPARELRAIGHQPRLRPRLPTSTSTRPTRSSASRSFGSDPDAVAELVAAAGRRATSATAASPSVGQALPRPRRHRHRQPRRLPGHHPHAASSGRPIDAPPFRAAITRGSTDHDGAHLVPGARRLGRPGHPVPPDPHRRPARRARLRRRHRHRLARHAGRPDQVRRRRGGRPRPPRRRRPAAHDPRDGRRVCRRPRRRPQPPHPARRADAKVRRVLGLKYRRGVVARPYADPAGVSPSSARPRTSRRPTRSPTARRRSSRTTPGPCRSPRAARRSSSPATASRRRRPSPQP